MYDVIIVGKGPAGLSSALYTVRANLNTLVIGMNNSAISKAEKIENYFGFENAISGKELLDAGEKQVIRLGAKVIEDQVIDIDIDEKGFKIATIGDVFQSKAVLISTGQVRKSFVIPGLKEFEGRGVSYCTTCDGFFYKKKIVGVIGSGDFALHEAEELEAFTDKISIFTNGSEMNAKEMDKLQKFTINNKKIKELYGEDVLTGIAFEDGSTIEIDGIFIAGETASGMDFARKLGIFVENNTIVVDKNQQTNLKGLFSAGDCAGEFKQISTAVGQGALAGRKIIEYIKKM